MRLDSLQRGEREAVVPRSTALEMRELDIGDAGVDGWIPPHTFHMICLINAQTTCFFHPLLSVGRAVLQPSLHSRQEENSEVDGEEGGLSIHLPREAPWPVTEMEKETWPTQLTLSAP